MEVSDPEPLSDDEWTPFAEFLGIEDGGQPTLGKHPEESKSEPRGLEGTADDELLAEVLDVVFDGPPGAEAGRFVEVEDQSGVKAGEWVERDGGMWALRLLVVRPVESAVSVVVATPPGTDVEVWPAGDRTRLEAKYDAALTVAVHAFRDALTKNTLGETEPSICDELGIEVADETANYQIQMAIIEAIRALRAGDRTPTREQIAAILVDVLMDEAIDNTTFPHVVVTATSRIMALLHGQGGETP